MSVLEKAEIEGRDGRLWAQNVKEDCISNRVLLIYPLLRNSADTIALSVLKWRGQALFPYACSRHLF